MTSYYHGLITVRNYRKEELLAMLKKERSIFPYDEIEEELTRREMVRRKLPY